jgi:hypothetical protein
MIHILSKQNLEEFETVGPVCRFTLARKDEHLRGPTLLIKAPSLQLKFLVKTKAFQILFLSFMPEQYLLYSVRVNDDPSRPLDIWSVVETQNELEAINSFLANLSCPIFLFNEGTAQVASGNVEFTARLDSETGRLSLRDLLWYCYLDQDDIDSSFFHLEDSAVFYKRLKSRDVLRFVIGFHNERIAELEAEIDRLRGGRQGLLATISGISKALKEMDVESEEQIRKRVDSLHKRIEELDTELETLRVRTKQRHTRHAADTLLYEARNLGAEIAKIDDATVNLVKVRDRDQRFLNE